MKTISPVHVQQFLAGVDYPTDKDTLVKHARQQDADQSVIDALQQMPASHFNSPNDVSQALGKTE